MKRDETENDTLIALAAVAVAVLLWLVIVFVGGKVLA
jgi:hypothetical protein